MSKYIAGKLVNNNRFTKDTLKEMDELYLEVHGRYAEIVGGFMIQTVVDRLSKTWTVVALEETADLYSMGGVLCSHKSEPVTGIKGIAVLVPIITPFATKGIIHEFLLRSDLGDDRGEVEDKLMEALLYGATYSHGRLEDVTMAHQAQLNCSGRCRDKYGFCWIGRTEVVKKIK